ncbi:ATP-binding protein, partial [Vibrio parahaemolyticus]
DIQIPPDFTVNGDWLRLRQILYNLLINAIKFTSVGSVKLLAIIAEQREQKAIVQISFHDTCIGIPADQLQTIFEEFTQVTASNSMH